MSRITACCLLLVFLVAAGPLSAARSGLWLEVADRIDRSEALALATDVDIQVTGMVAMVEVRQQFFNQTGDWAEGVYRFPLPDHSAVEQLQIRLGNRLIEGEIQEKKSARATYEAARERGQVAGLVERDQGNLFTTRVANVPPGEMVEIRIGFTQPVRYEHGRFRLGFPTTAAPRFRPSGELERAVRERLESSLDAGLPQRPVQLTVDLRSGLRLSRVESTHHEIDVEEIGSDRLVTLGEGADWSGRDFELIWEPEDIGEAATAAFAESFGGREHVMLTLVPPQAFEARDTPREVILIMDTSGSMSNQPIEQARDSLHYALASLKVGDRFNVIEFNHQARSLYPQPRTFNEDRHVEAAQWVDALAAGGGTDMGPPLSLALSASPSDGYLRQVVFITDGMVGNEQELLERTSLELGESRLFTVGIGHGVNGSFLRRLAAAGRGSYTGIAQSARIAERMSELVLQLESPVIHDIEVVWPRPVEFHPETIPDLYVGQPLSVIARADRLSGDVIVRGTSNGRHFERVLPLEDFQPAPGVASQWGRSRIESLENRIVPPGEKSFIESEVLDTALAYSLVSSQTSLVAVDQTPARSRDAAMQRHRLDTSPAHGRAGSLQAMPATDAGSVPAALRGALALLLVGLLLFQRRINRDGEQSLMRRFLVISLLLLASWQFGSAGWIQAKAQLGQFLLERSWQQAREGERGVEPWPGAVSHPVARLRMPRLSVDHLVLEGLEDPVMAWGPGMAVGEGGHRILAAHRDTHFAFLSAVEVGDRFELVEADGRQRWWQVELIRVVDSRKTGIDLDWHEQAMTLITCYPFDAPVAGGPQRLVVRLRPLAPAKEAST